ncbi:hypothetical protein KP509_26G010500 [Ceratopteris richardii]|uniref:Uncharacterized protein n=1 Tax=Ceratopteris richardii TaxID=49495 RepID=A0A8T2RHZ8_CERRI|nr:hypothetical protein KP509_26G010500 [Ceratopteris richardii]
MSAGSVGVSARWEEQYLCKHRASLNILTSKTGPRNYYKGKNCLSTGRHTSKGKYILIAEKLPKYVVPDLTGFPLKPYVEHSTPKNIP